jgi:hypothetical protein
MLTTTRSAHVIPESRWGTLTWEPEDNLEYALDPDGDWYDEAVEADVMEETGPITKQKKQRSKVSVWLRLIF